MRPSIPPDVKSAPRSRLPGVVLQLRLIGEIPRDELGPTAEVAARGLACCLVDDAPATLRVGRVDDLAAPCADAQQVAIDDRVDGASAVCESRRDPGVVLAPPGFPLSPVEIDGPQPFLLSARLLVALGSLLQ